MKSSKHILSLLTRQPQFSSLSQHSCYQKFIKLLPPRFQTAIAFIYIQNRTLFVALSHPGYKMELNYNKELFKTLLATAGTHVPECQGQSAEKVVFFNSKYHMPRITQCSDTVPYYGELSLGNFKITEENDALKEKFLYTKALIERQRSTTEEK